MDAAATRRSEMPYDPREFSEKMQLENILFRAETALENSLIYALYNKAQQIDDAQLREEIKQYAPKVKYEKDYLGYVGTISMPISPPNANIDWNIKRARMSWNPSWFLERLAPTGEMDYKHSEANLKYEDFGNFNDGAVALAFGLSEQAALRGAGLVQIIVDAYRLMGKNKTDEAKQFIADHGLDFLKDEPYGDQFKDQHMIKQGFRYYKEVYLDKYSERLSVEERNIIKQRIAEEATESFCNGTWKIESIMKKAVE